MLRKKITLNHILALVAVLGILSAVYMLVLDQRPIPVSHPITPPAVSPYASFISGAGLTEAASENIALGTLIPGTVDNVLVVVGDVVKKGAPLFTLDSRQAKADLKVKKSQLAAAKTALEQAGASLLYAQHALALVSTLQDKRGVTKEELINRQDNVRIAQKALENAQANVTVAQANVDESKTTLSLYTIRAPLDCQLMQVNVHPGEYAPANELLRPLILLGNVHRYHIRVDVDENDAWRFKKDQPAVAFLRGNIQYKADLKFEYIEPYVIPKASFTGDPTERVDTRVLQVVYSYDPKAMPAYLGQEVDVYIQAEKVSGGAQYGGPLAVSR